jgi:uncharacterized protein (DUF1697 family)
VAPKPVARRAAPTHVALLRGINVGRAKRVAMADLRALVEGLGYADVKTLLNSGNVLFTAGAKDARDHAARIEKAMTKELGVSARVTVLPAAGLAAIVAGNPLLAKSDNPSCLLVTVFRQAADRAKLVALAKKQDWAPDAIAVGRGAAYLWCPRGMLASELAETMVRSLGDGVTTRNWATMTKLHALLDSDEVAARA